jgi:hypothetical protein
MTEARDRASDDRSCFVHVGVHKTGTTAIQRFLADNSDALASAGLYYPRAGRRSAEFPGHHNVASELLGSATFDPSAGTLADVTEEMVRARSPRVCLSSEKFAVSCQHEAALTTLREAIAATGYRPRIVIYVRAQAEYAESLYAQLVQHGMTRAVVDYLDELVRDGAVREGATFDFEFGRLIERFAEVFGRNAVVVRGYVDRGTAASLIDDFLAAIGVRTPLAPDLIVKPPAYENRRPNTGEVIARLRANGAGGMDGVAQNEADASLPFHPFGPADRARIAARFRADNAELVRTWGLDPATFTDDPPWRDPDAARRARELVAHAFA